MMKRKLDSQRLKIMQIAPFGLPIREDIKYGGIERVVFNIDKELNKRGHESYVVATRNSSVNGTLCPTLPLNTFVLKFNNKGEQKFENIATLEDYEKHCEKALQYIQNIKPDVIHDQFHEHPDFLRSKAFQENDNLPPVLRTLHGPLNANNKEKFIELKKSTKGRNVYFCALSKSQKKDFNKVMSVDYVVENGIDVKAFPFQDQGNGYIFSLGLICDYKGQDIALDVAKKLRKKIIIAGPVHDSIPKMKAYWEREIKPEIEIFEENIPPEQIGDFVKDFMKSKYNSGYAGELNDKQKIELFKRANASYFPIRWQEPSGLVMIESNACGTPVIAYKGGSVPEIIQHGKNGYVVELGDFDGFCHYASKVDDLSRKACREHVEENFTIEKQADKLLEIYGDMISRSSMKIK